MRPLDKANPRTGPHAGDSAGTTTPESIYNYTSPKSETKVFYLLLESGSEREREIEREWRN